MQLYCYDFCNSTDILCFILTVSTSYWCACKWIYRSKRM